MYPKDRYDSKINTNSNNSNALDSLDNKNIFKTEIYNNKKIIINRNKSKI